MIFDYNPQAVMQNQLQIDDLGNFAICAEGEEGEYYLAACTNLGQTAILRFGPLADGAVCGFLNLTYMTMPYKEPKIISAVNQFLTDQKKKITEAEIITERELLEALPDIGAVFLPDWSNEGKESLEDGD